jgi:ribose transport system ATP-binding protein
VSEGELSGLEATAHSALELIDISKRYGGVQALERASFACRAGRVHALLGENGAGKSTLIKVMTGVVQPDSGRLLVSGREQRFAHPRAAHAAGIACIFQELSLLPALSVADNICLVDPPRRFGLIDGRAQRRIAERALARAGAEDIHPLASVASLPLSRRQLVEIAKALARAPQVLILDEATSALGAAEVERLLALLARLRAEGLSIVYISHRLHEIRQLADDCTVLRNGRHVGSFEAGARDDRQVVALMLGRELEAELIGAPAASGDAEAPAETPDARAPVLEVRGLSWRRRLVDIHLQLRRGEIVGLGGLEGHGQRELLLALFGVLRGVDGELLLDGKPLRLASPRAAKHPDVGIALVPEDRKTDGLILGMSVRDNLTLAALERLTHMKLISAEAEATATRETLARLSIAAPDVDAPVSTLSGGNQQKVVIGKWLLNQPRILLLSDPTRGIDVGTKREIYRLLRRLAAEGAAIVLYSTDHLELVGCCDRVLVMYEGRAVRWLAGAQLNEHELLASALNLPSGSSGAAKARAATPAAGAPPAP